MEGAMKAIVLSDRFGKVQSVVLLEPEFASRFRVELEGGGETHEVDVDPGVIVPDELMGKNGLERQRQAHDALQRLIQRKD
jgi:hypothetical protein